MNEEREKRCEVMGMKSFSHRSFLQMIRMNLRIIFFRCFFFTDFRTLFNTLGVFFQTDSCSQVAHGIQKWPFLPAHIVQGTLQT